MKLPIEIDQAICDQTAPDPSTPYRDIVLLERGAEIALTHVRSVIDATKNRDGRGYDETASPILDEDRESLRQELLTALCLKPFTKKPGGER
jgi:hypothetical protein